MKVIVRYGWARQVAAKTEDMINSILDSGYGLVEFHVVRMGWFRVMLIAIFDESRYELADPDEDDD